MMKLTQNLRAEILKVYNSYWDSFFRGDMRTFASVLHDDVQIIGSSANETFNSKRAAMKFYRSTVKQVAGKTGFRNRHISVRPAGNGVMITERSDFYALVGDTWTFYGRGRISTLFCKTDNGWKIIHEHGSLPDPKAGEGEQINTQKIKAENLRLRDAVKRRTKELEQKNQELEVEAALERVSAVAMGMKAPSDMLEICRTISVQLEALDVKDIRNVQTAIFYPQRGTYMNYEYYAKHRRTIITETSYSNNKIHKAFAKKMLKGEGEFFTTHIKGKKVKEWIAYQKTTNVFIDTYLNTASSLSYYWYSLGPVALGISSYSPLTSKDLNLFKRFRNVFELAYRRYLDIEKAEAQARESRIQLALERVRARTMAMTRSEELTDTSLVLFHEFKALGTAAEQVTIAVVHEEEQAVEIFVTLHGNAIDSSYRVKAAEHPAIRKIYDAFRSGERSVVIHLNGDELRNYNAWRNEMRGEPLYPLEVTRTDHWYINSASFSRGLLSFSTREPAATESVSLLERFADTFNLTYTRFLDLQKSEAQAREAQIDAALERVRSKAMAMHNSSDVAVTVSTVFVELRKLGVHSIRAGVALYSHGRRAPTFYASTTSEDNAELAVTGSPDPAINPCLAKQYEAWQKKEDYFPVLHGEELKAYYSALSLQPSAHFHDAQPFDHEEHGYYLPFSEGNFYAWSERSYTTDELTILHRFKAIIDLTFRRYLDLQTAEAQAREAQIEASLERVRSRTLAMQRSDELAETAAVLFKQLIALGIAPNRLYIGIIQDESGNAEFWITDEDGSKVSSGFSANLHGNRSFRKMLDGWQNGEKSLTIDMQGEELREYFRHLGALNVPFKGGLTQKRRVQNIAYFSKGFIGIASPDQQPEATTALLERFAAVFNLTFTRFHDLQLAEAQARQAHLDLIQLQKEKQRAEEALGELRAAQEQLVQQEKLASLGQLTAGIAHEIKNPLNFVNNFSSVSVELVDEVTEEINKGAPDLQSGNVPHLLRDIRTNLGKIVEHGTRADSIVKSMLQHSRGGSRRREPVDVNALIKEYVTLAFHGMRASKNPINVDIQFAFDQSAGSVSLIAEDFSRVILNLCQNAFDAMREKGNTDDRKQGSYKPRLAARTHREANKIRVTIEDNGPGIPDAIKDKVLQPFFTTKKGTQGTGLGLSISNDIVKAHGGEMNVETNGDGGATFTITLPLESQA